MVIEPGTSHSTKAFLGPREKFTHSWRTKNFTRLFTILCETTHSTHNLFTRQPKQRNVGVHQSKKNRFSRCCTEKSIRRI